MLGLGGNRGGGDLPGPRVQRTASSVRIEMGGKSDARREAALGAALLPPHVVVRRDTTHVARSRGRAGLGSGAGRVVLLKGKLVTWLLEPGHWARFSGAKLTPICE